MMWAQPKSVDEVDEPGRRASAFRCFAVAGHRKGRVATTSVAGIHCAPMTNVIVPEPCDAGAGSAE
jgi:hypothetical protein